MRNIKITHILILLTWLLCACAGSGSTPTPSGNAPKVIIGYFAAWGVYDRQYFVKNIQDSGTAAKLTHLNFAFANISLDLQCEIGDPWADVQMPYTAANSVDGQADPQDETGLAGSFNQLRKLKAQYPHLKVLIAVGGWSWSERFSDAALTAESRQAFVQSCIELFIKGQFASDVPAVPGIFDGIDIDWEYPAAPGDVGHLYRPEDTQNFTLLLAEFRSQLDALSATTGQPYLLTIASAAGRDKLQKMQLIQIHQYLDYINLMAYDFHGTWDTTTNFHAALYGSPSDPHYALQLSGDSAVQTYLDAGTPAHKMVLGVPFYGRGWQDVPSTNNGLYQSSTGGAPGTYEAGVDDYKVLKGLAATYGQYRDPITQAFWLYNPSTRIFWTYDDPTVLAAKMAYVKDKNLGGTMFWELSGDDDTGTLITALYHGLR